MDIAPVRSTQSLNDLNAADGWTEEVNKKKEHLDELDRRISNLKSKIALSRESKTTHIRTRTGISCSNKTIKAQQQTLDALEKEKLKKIRRVSWNNECDTFEIPHKEDRYPTDFRGCFFLRRSEEDRCVKEFERDIRNYAREIFLTTGKKLSVREAKLAVCQLTPEDLVLLQDFPGRKSS